MSDSDANYDSNDIEITLTESLDPAFHVDEFGTTVLGGSLAGAHLGGNLGLRIGFYLGLLGIGLAIGVMLYVSSGAPTGKTIAIVVAVAIGGAGVFMLLGTVFGGLLGAIILGIKTWRVRRTNREAMIRDAEMTKTGRVLSTDEED